MGIVEVLRLAGEAQRRYAVDTGVNESVDEKPRCPVVNVPAPGQRSGQIGDDAAESLLPGRTVDRHHKPTSFIQPDPTNNQMAIDTRPATADTRHHWEAVLYPVPNSEGRHLRHIASGR
ncbi:hypothetical protein [Propionibacterium freudenreichii]|uniref:hypothetical protein n=1 Tax=Propionibacterium freudenreichii TaxID=1744 RepID=UPI0021A53A4B|nr:hypothetical protein [Propionibacterium freudenreichii]